jgi:hypothetical protein
MSTVTAHGVGNLIAVALFNSVQMFMIFSINYRSLYRRRNYAYYRGFLRFKGKTGHTSDLYITKTAESIHKAAINLQVKRSTLCNAHYVMNYIIHYEI